MNIFYNQEKKGAGTVIFKKKKGEKASETHKKLKQFDSSSINNHINKRIYEKTNNIKNYDYYHGKKQTARRINQDELLEKHGHDFLGPGGKIKGTVPKIKPLTVKVRYFPTKDIKDSTFHEITLTNKSYLWEVLKVFCNGILDDSVYLGYVICNPYNNKSLNYGDQLYDTLYDIGCNYLNVMKTEPTYIEINETIQNN